MSQVMTVLEAEVAEEDQARLIAAGTPGGVLVFRSVNAEPRLAIFGVAASRQA